MVAIKYIIIKPNKNLVLFLRVSFDVIPYHYDLFIKKVLWVNKLSGPGQLMQPSLASKEADQPGAAEEVAVAVIV